MKKILLLLPFFGLVIAVSAAWSSYNERALSDKVWFETDEEGVAIDPNNGRRGESSPFNCPGLGDPCARALSIMDGEVSLNSGSSTVYHINTGYNTVDDYDDEENKP